MKKVAIIAISVGIVVAALLSVAIGIASYQQAVIEENVKEYEKGADEFEKTLEEIKKMDEKPAPTSSTSVSKYCSGNAACFAGKVTSVVDGDTIHVDGKSIRFSLASAPELSELGGLDAKQFVSQICPVGSEAIVDEDDFQTQGSYGRMIAVIYCNGVNLNQSILEVGLGQISTSFCSQSEFASESWAQKYGCEDKVTQAKLEPPKQVPQTTQTNCDPSYPTVCIPPYPPDLDCGEISHERFEVLQPDPHGFDGDKDGMGCES